ELSAAYDLLWPAHLLASGTGSPNDRRSRAGSLASNELDAAGDALHAGLGGEDADGDLQHAFRRSADRPELFPAYKPPHRRPVLLLRSTALIGPETSKERRCRLRQCRRARRSSTAPPRAAA